jgi:hypothetical protein
MKLSWDAIRLLSHLDEGGLGAEVLGFFRMGPGLLVAIALEEIFDLMGKFAIHLSPSLQGR